MSQVNSPLSKSYKIKPVKEYLFAKFENLFIATLYRLNNTCFKASKHEHDFFKSSSYLNKTKVTRERGWFS